MITVPACSKIGQSSAGAPASGTGGISFRLIWQRTPLSRAAAQFSPLFNACADHAVETVDARVLDAADHVVASDSWPCSAHEGLLGGVPAGTNYRVEVDGKNFSGSTTWTGLASGITVITGQTTDGGTVVMNYAGTDNVRPAVTSLAPASNPSTTTNVPVTARILIAFSEQMAISTITTTNITLINSSDTSAVSGLVSYNTASNTAAFTPSANVAYNTQYVLQVLSCSTGTSCITDIADNRLESDSTFTFTTESGPGAAPDAPSAVTARPGNSQVTVDWLAATGAASYNVYYGTAPGVTITNGVKIADARAPFVHIGLTNDLTYYYLVTAVNGFGETQAAVEVNATPALNAANPNVPLPPANFTVTVGDNQNVLSWSAAAGATSYNLYWSTVPIAPDKNSADHVIRNVTSPYTHAGLTNGQTYYYMVTARNSFGESAESAQVAAIPITGGAGGTGF